MPAVYVDRRDIRIEYAPGVIVLRGPDGQPQRIPLAQVDYLLTRSNLSIDTAVLTNLAEQGTAILLMDGRAGNRVAYVDGYRHGSAARRIRQYRAYLDAGFRLRLSRLLMIGKLRNQHRLLRDALAMRPDQRRMLVRGMQSLRSAMNSALTTDGIDSLRGIEGAAAAAYFGSYASILPADCGFNGRNRRPPRDPVNAALSLGYSLLQADALRAIRLAGLDPMLGTYHDLAPGRDSLACDLTELHRADIDRIVWRLFAERALQTEHFESLNGAVLMKKAARASFYPAYEAWAAANRTRLLQRAQAYSKALPPLADMPDPEVQPDTDQRP
jgi:CRISP-associated protein Cas1